MFAISSPPSLTSCYTRTDNKQSITLLVLASSWEWEVFPSASLVVCPTSERKLAHNASVLDFSFSSLLAACSSAIFFLSSILCSSTISGPLLLANLTEINQIHKYQIQLAKLDR